MTVIDQIYRQVYHMRQTGHYQALAKLDAATAQAFVETCVKPALAAAHRAGLAQAKAICETERKRLCDRTIQAVIDDDSECAAAANHRAAAAAYCASAISRAMEEKQ